MIVDSLEESIRDFIEASFLPVFYDTIITRYGIEAFPALEKLEREGRIRLSIEQRRTRVITTKGAPSGSINHTGGRVDHGQTIWSNGSNDSSGVQVVGGSHNTYGIVSGNTNITGTFTVHGGYNLFSRSYGWSRQDFDIKTPHTLFMGCRATSVNETQTEDGVVIKTDFIVSQSSGRSVHTHQVAGFHAAVPVPEAFVLHYDEI